MDFLQYFFNCKCTVKKALSAKKPSQFSLLKRAVKAGDSSRVKALLKQQTQLHFTDRGDLLWLAVVRDEIDIASMLVEAGADFNQRRPFNILRPNYLHELVASSDQRHHRLAAVMLEYGANVELRDDDRNGLTPLHYAIRNKSDTIYIIGELLRYGARVYRLHIVEAANHPKAAEVMALLVGGVDAKTRSQRIDDGLNACAFMGSERESLILPTVKLLLEMKLPASEMVMGRWTFMRAIKSNMVNMVQLLVEYGFDVNGIARPGIESPLYAASSLEEADITKLLVQAGANVNAYAGDDNGYKGYAIHAACLNESVKNIQILLHHGANVQVTDSDGQTPLSLLEYTEDYISLEQQAIIRHLAILKIKGQKINDDDWDTIKSHEEMNSYFKECLKELEKMKLTRIVSDVTFFSIFQDELWKILFIMRDYDSNESIYFREHRLDEFPFYSEDMVFAIQNAKRYKTLLGEKEEALCESLKKVLPYIPLEKIIYYMYMNEFK